jgi:hypothetical protein
MQTLLDDWSVGEQKRANQTLEMRSVLRLQARLLFSRYQPYKASPKAVVQPFEERLDAWLKQFSSVEHQWSAFHSLKYFFYLGEEETFEMYRCAFKREILPWLADNANIDVFSSTCSFDIDAALKQSWPCPISDSFRINEFLHATHMNGQTYRPDWRSMKKFADERKIQTFAEINDLKYLVLLEDFVGSGTQIKSVLRHAMQSFNGKILFIPLVVCSKGHCVIKEIVSQDPARIAYRPIIVLDDRFLISESATQGEPESFEHLRLALVAAFNTLSGGNVAGDNTAFGFKKTGCLYSSFSNCPNNTPPAYHSEMDNWPIALFPRFERI